MPPLSRSSRICLLCIHHSSKPRFYASGAAAKKTSAKVKKLTPLNGETPETRAGDTPPKPTARKAPYKSRIESFLEDLDASPKAPTPEDLYLMKPGVPAGPNFPNYSQEYDASLKRIMRAFRQPQLIALANKLGYDDKLPPNQREIAQILLEKSWGWLPPHVVEQKAKEQVDVVTKDLPVAPSLVLLLLSEDSNAMSELGRRFGLNVALQTVDGTVFQIQGNQEGISALESYLDLREREVLTETMDVPSSTVPSLSILRLAGRQSQTYIELPPERNYLGIAGFSDEAIRKAKRMIQRYMNKSLLEARIPMLWHLSSQQPDVSESVASEYAFMPFHPIKPPHWSMSSRKLFRMKQVAEWLEDGDTAWTDYLSDGTFIDKSASSAELSYAFPLLSAPRQPGCTRSYYASVGHTVFTLENATPTTMPPGKWPLEGAISHVKDMKLASSFLPSLPSPLLSSPPSSITTVHRAVYRRNFDATIISENLVSVPSDVFILEVAMEHTAASAELDDLDGVDIPAESISIKPLEGPTRCQVGIEGSLDLLLPERPMDIRLTVRDLQPVTEQGEPEAIKIYLQELLRFLNFTIDQQPTTPDSIEYNDVQYYLDTSSSVRRTEEYFSSHRSGWDDTQESDLDVEAISETSLDLESKEKTSCCFIRTNECATEDDFNVFLARCAIITSMPFTSLTQASEEPKVPYFSE